MSETLKRVNELLSGDFNKVSLSEELGISRPTLNTRLIEDNWKKAEKQVINILYSKNGDSKRK